MHPNNTGLTSAQLNLLHDGVRKLKLELSQSQLESMGLYLSQVQKWRERINLVSLSSKEELISHHALDSLALTPFITDSRQVLDIGTGAGFPGMLLAVVAPQVSFSLLDSRQRRIEFLRMVNARLGLSNVHFLCGRVEEITGPEHLQGLRQSGVQMPVKFDTLVARAVASLDQLVTLTLPLQAEGVRLLAMKGKYPREELDKLEARHSGRIKSVQLEPLKVPYLDAQRHLVSIQF